MSQRATGPFSYPLCGGRYMVGYPRNPSRLFVLKTELARIRYHFSLPSVGADWGGPV